MGTGKATRRAVLIVGGVALLTGYWKDPAQHPEATSQAHPVPAHPAATPHSAPARARLARARPHRGQGTGAVAATPANPCSTSTTGASTSR